MCDKMVADLVARRRCCKTTRGKDIWKIGKKSGDTVWGEGEKEKETAEVRMRGTRKEKNC